MPGDRLLHRDPAHLLPSETNLGGAGGYAYGVLTARALGADWVWLADDDGRPGSSWTLGRLLVCAADHDLDVVSPLVVDQEDPERLAFPLRRGLRWVRQRGELGADVLVPNVANLFNGALFSAGPLTRWVCPTRGCSSAVTRWRSTDACGAAGCASAPARPRPTSIRRATMTGRPSWVDGSRSWFPGPGRRAWHLPQPRVPHCPARPAVAPLARRLALRLVLPGPAARPGRLPALAALHAGRAAASGSPLRPRDRGPTALWQRDRCR